MAENSRDVDPPEHICNINNGGSSGAMETVSALKLTKEVYNETGGVVYIQHLIIDDDSTLHYH